MDKLVRDFFYEGGSKHPCRNLVNWGQTSLLVNMGGLGIRAFGQRSNALLTKWLRRFSNEEKDFGEGLLRAFTGLSLTVGCLKFQKAKLGGDLGLTSLRTQLSTKILAV